MNKKFRFVAVRLVAVLLLATIVMPAAPEASADEISSIPEGNYVVNTVHFGTHWCDYYNPYNGVQYEKRYRVLKHQNHGNNPISVHINDTHSITADIKFSAGFGNDVLDLAVEFSVTESRTFTVDTDITVPARSVGKVKIFDRFQEVKSDYICYWWPTAEIHSRGTITVGRYIGSRYVVKTPPLNSPNALADDD